MESSAIEMISPTRYDEPGEIGRVVHCPHCSRPVIRVPLLRCMDCARVHALRAYTYRSSHGYIAECLDLDILTQGVTEEEAIGKLQISMHGYLGLAFGGSSTHGLVPRPSPFAHWFRYYLHRARGLLGRPPVGTRHLIPAADGERYRLLHSN